MYSDYVGMILKFCIVILHFDFLFLILAKRACTMF